VKFCN
jgi:hypothetical protein